MMNVWKSNADSMMLLTIYELFNSDGPPIVAVAQHVRLALELNASPGDFQKKDLLACRLSS